MKSQMNLACIFGSLLLTSHLAAESQFSLMAEEYVDNICRTANAIVNVPEGQQTFENTLRPWNRLSAKLKADSCAAEAQLPPNETASQMLNDLRAYLLEVSRDPELHQAMMSVVQNAELDPFQGYIGGRFIKNGSNEAVYLQGESVEKNTAAADFALLSFKSSADGQFSDLISALLSEGIDVACIQDVLADAHAYDLYEAIRGNYAHFIYIPPTAALEGSRGMLIASKYCIEQAQFNTLQGGNEGFVDFILKNEDRTIGHIYATNLGKDAVDLRLQVVEKMQDDSLQVEEESFPFVLCGDLDSLPNSRNSLPLNPPRDLPRLRSPRLATRKTDGLLGGFKILPVKSHRDRDRDRNDDRQVGGGFEVGGTMHYGGKDGPTFEGYVKGDVHDNKGNYAEGRIDHDFNKNEGDVDVHGGNRSDIDKNQR
jgi:hypothetical protein